jgi:superfamily II DNA or RNA helicase
MSNTILCKEGYLIEKKNNKDIENIKKELTVVPFICNNFVKPKPFKIYKENDKYISLPKFYGLNKYGIPKYNFEYEGKQINITFNSELRNNQIDVINNILPKIKENYGGVLCLPCGFGKCLGYNTEILMYDGTIKYVQDIQINDIIMGDDSKPRTIKNTVIGLDSMYKIKLSDETFYMVNKEHILSLKCITNESLLINNKIYNNNDIIDIELLNYINLNNDIKNKLKGYRNKINFNIYNNISNSYKYGIHIATQYINNKFIFIDKNYIINSEEIRKEFYKGIMIVFNLYYSHKKILISNKEFINTFIFLCRSLGYHININKNYIEIIENHDLLYDIDVEYINYDYYYGFELYENNKRFVLGDFTITHNTVLSLYLISQFKLKTLIIVHKNFLLNQWIERAKQFTNAKIGYLFQNKIDVDNKDIVIGMLQSIAKDKYDFDIFKDFGMVIFDEAHHAPSQYFSRALPIISSKYTIGLSATPTRQDKLEKILYWYFGDILYKFDNVVNNNVIVNIHKYYSDNPTFKEYKLKTGDFNRPKTINYIVEIEDRNNYIIDILLKVLDNPLRKILILSDRINHLKNLKLILDSKNKCISDFYIGGMKQKDLNIAENATVIFASYSMASEALDIPDLNTLFLTTPRSEIEQAIGRIIRKINPDINPTIYDFVDQLNSFINQGYVRRRFYKKREFNINIFSNNNNIESDNNYEIIDNNNNDDNNGDFIDE